MLLRAAFALAAILAPAVSHACIAGSKETATCNEDGSTKGSAQANPNAPDRTLAPSTSFDFAKLGVAEGRRFVGATPIKIVTTVTGPYWSGGAQKYRVWCINECLKLATCVAFSGQPSSPWSWNTGTTQAQCKLFGAVPPQTSELAYEPGWKHRWNCKQSIDKSSGTVQSCWMGTIESRLPKAQQNKGTVKKKPGT